MRIELSRCVVRSLNMNDVAALTRDCSRRDLWIDLYCDSSFSKPVSEKWLQKVIATKPERMLAIEADEEAVGIVGFCRQEGPQRLSAQIGCWLSNLYRNRGLATEAIRVVTEYAMSSHELVRIFAYITKQNLGAMRALEKCGFAQEGVLRQNLYEDGRIVDQLLYARVRTVKPVADASFSNGSTCVEVF